MPELPEVEMVRRGLELQVAGRTMESVRVLHPRAVRRHLPGPADFEAALAGRVIGVPRRRGKYLWLPVGEDALVAHLGMSGQFLVGDPARPVAPHVRVRFTFDDRGPDLRFTDQRTFGHLLLTPRGPDGPAPPGPAGPSHRPDDLAAPGLAAPGLAASGHRPDDLAAPGLAAPGHRPDGLGLPTVIAHIAPDPLEPAFDEKALAVRLRRRRTGIKRALLDQSLISGVGNIYADEALWRARLHWARPTETMTGSEISRLVTAVKEVLRDALVAGGTSFDSLYVNVSGESGYFSTSLAVYGREDQPCPRCGTPVRRDRFMNRSAFSCPRCQPRPRRGRW